MAATDCGLAHKAYSTIIKPSDTVSFLGDGVVPSGFIVPSESVHEETGHLSGESVLASSSLPVPVPEPIIPAGPSGRSFSVIAGEMT